MQPEPLRLQLQLQEDRVATSSKCHFLVTAEALLAISEQGLYRAAGFASFSDYVAVSGRVHVKWRQARHLVAAARFCRLLQPADTRPCSERQVRCLAGQPKSVALAAWRMAVDRAASSNGRVCGSVVKQCLLCLTSGEGERMPPLDTGGREGGSGSPDAYAGFGSGSESEGADGAEGEQVGGGNCVVTRGRAAAFLSNESTEWYAPDEVLVLVRRMFAPGGIDLDPCSSARANQRVGAAKYYDAAADGLATGNVWSGNVFCNPPYSTRDGQSMQALFFERCRLAYLGGTITQAVLLLKAAVGFAWFRRVTEWPTCFVATRLCFVREVGCQGGPLSWGRGMRNPHGSVVVYMGADVQRFADLFSQMGYIPGVSGWALGARAPPVPTGAQDDTDAPGEHVQ